MAKGPEGLREVRQAYSYTLDRMGQHAASGQLWLDYLSFLKTPKQGTPAFDAVFGFLSGYGDEEGYRDGSGYWLLAVLSHVMPLPSGSVAVYLAYALVPQGWMIFLVILLGALGAVDEPATQALLSASVDETEQGAIQGAVASLLSITAIVGPLVSTAVFSYFTSAAAPVTFAGAPLAFGALLVLAALVVAWRFVRPAPRPVALPEPALALAV